VHCVAAKFVPHLLIDDQKEQRSAVSQELRHPANEEENFINDIVTGNETWIYDMDMTLKTKNRYSSQMILQSYPGPEKDKKPGSLES
jgi:hypothetical protein